MTPNGIELSRLASPRLVSRQILPPGRVLYLREEVGLVGQLSNLLWRSLGRDSSTVRDILGRFPFRGEERATFDIDLRDLNPHLAGLSVEVIGVACGESEQEEFASGGA
jgi:hypothetical protein